jgi:hypothetical protein
MFIHIELDGFNFATKLGDWAGCVHNHNYLCKLFIFSNKQEKEKPYIFFHLKHIFRVTVCFNHRCIKIWISFSIPICILDQCFWYLPDGCWSDSQIRWFQQCERAFLPIADARCKRQLFHEPDKRQHQIQCAAHSSGLRFTLLQLQCNGKNLCEEGWSNGYLTFIVKKIHTVLMLKYYFIGYLRHSVPQIDCHYGFIITCLHSLTHVHALCWFFH